MLRATARGLPGREALRYKGDAPFRPRTCGVAHRAPPVDRCTLLRPFSQPPTMFRVSSRSSKGFSVHACGRGSQLHGFPDLARPQFFHPGVTEAKQGWTTGASVLALETSDGFEFGSRAGSRSDRVGSIKINTLSFVVKSLAEAGSQRDEPRRWAHGRAICAEDTTQQSLEGE